MNVFYTLLRDALTILTKPNPPPHIRLTVYRSDTCEETPCELIHHGRDRNGIDHWEIAGHAFRFGLDELRGLETLPHQTSITFHTTGQL